MILWNSLRLCWCKSSWFNFQLFSERTVKSDQSFERHYPISYLLLHNVLIRLEAFTDDLCWSTTQIKVKHTGFCSFKINWDAKWCPLCFVCSVIIFKSVIFMAYWALLWRLWFKKSEYDTGGCVLKEMLLGRRAAEIWPPLITKAFPAQPLPAEK